MAVILNLFVLGTEEINLYPWMIRAAMEYICQAGFGYTFNALEDENNEYVNAVRNLTYVLQTLLGIVLTFCPSF